MSLLFPVGDGTIQIAETVNQIHKECLGDAECINKAEWDARLISHAYQFTEEQRKTLYMIPLVGWLYGGFDAIKEGDIIPLLQAGMSQTEIGGIIMMLYRNQPNAPTENQITQKIKDASSTTLDPNEERFSQNTVSYNKTERGTGVKYTYDDLVLSMKKDGWKGDPVDVVKMNDGQYTSMDNIRIAATREAGVDVKANTHNFNDPLSSAEKLGSKIIKKASILQPDEKQFKVELINNLGN